MSRLEFATASALAKRIAEGRVSAQEVLDAHLGQIARHNSAVNAIVTLDKERARTRAREADAALARGELWGPLHGVPVTIKDAIATAGLRTTGGFPPLADYVPAQDASVVARLRAAGAIILGKTNVPVLSADFRADNPIFGRTNNPWDLDRMPGGSTGGGAAAVASGFSPLEIGSDHAGSIRNPAHFCGVYGLKPSEYRVPLTGHIPEPPGFPRAIRHMNTIGPLARSVEDLTLAFRLIAGPDGAHWEIPPVPLDAAPIRALANLRLAWTHTFDDYVASNNTRTALEQLAGELASHGCRIAQSTPEGFSFPAAWEGWGAIAMAERAATNQGRAAERVAAIGATVTSDLALYRGMARGVSASLGEFTEYLNQRDALIGVLERFFDGWDAFLCPAAIGPAILHRPFGEPVLVDGRTVPYLMFGIAFTSPFSLTGHPAVVVPLTRSPEGLPIGLQIVGRRWGEMKLLAIAQAIARIMPPYQPPPGF